MKIKTLVGLLLGALVMTACNFTDNTEKGTPIAKVYDNYLYSADLVGVVPAGTPKKDSVALVTSYVDGWIRNKLLIKQAERNLTQKQQDFSKKLDEYRNSLLTYTYEAELIKQKLDTNVTESEISSYYLLNKGSFQLRYNIVKAVYVVLPDDSKELKRFQRLLKDPDTIMSATIDYLAKQYATSFYIGDETWIRFDDLLQQLPIQTFNQELFLKNNSYVEIKDKPFIYMIRFKDYMISESSSPLELETENIRNIILNKRKQSFLRSMHEELYSKALREELFEIF